MNRNVRVVSKPLRMVERTTPVKTVRLTSGVGANAGIAEIHCRLRIVHDGAHKASATAGKKPSVPLERQKVP
jgi:hypothetical protein